MQPHVVTDLTGRFRQVPPGPWPDPPTTAVVIPVASGKPREPTAFLVAGVSSRLRFDDAYRGFLDLVATQIATAIANARAYEQERKRAEALAELDRAKTAFFSNVSHEFRTPLTLILGPIEDLLARGDAEVAPGPKGQLEVVHRNSLRLLKLVNTMLDFSRIEAGRVRANYEPTDLGAYTAGLAGVFRAAVERAGLRFVVDCAPLPEPVYVDRDMWEKIVLNLLSNAFKFTLDGEIEVRVEAADEQARLTVRDTGVGIPVEEMPRIFERFHRVPETRGRTHEGTGIGLALVLELAKLHGGTVTAESVLDRGSRFVVSLPLGKRHLDPQRVGAMTGQAATTGGADAFVREALRWLPEDDQGSRWQADQVTREVTLSPCHPVTLSSSRPRVLWADDNADMREYVARLLGGRFDVQAVADGRAALEAARADPPAVVLADVMMPRLDGVGLLRELRADLRLRDVPVILVSARAGEEARVEGMSEGADDYLVKQFAARELVARVEAHVRLARARQAATEALRDRGNWLYGQREALAAALNGAPLETALGILVRTAAGALGDGTRAAFYLANGDGTSLHHVAGMSADYAAAVDGFKIGPESLACGLATHTGQPVLTADVMTDPRWEPWRAMAQRFDYRGCWSFPIHTSAGKFIGTFAVYSRQPREAAARDLDLAALLTQTGAMIISRHTEAQERKQAETALRENQTLLGRELEAARRLQEVSSLLIEEHDGERLYEQILDAAMAIMGAQFASIQMLDADRNELRLLASRNFHPDSAKYWTTIAGPAGTVCGAALKYGERVVTPDVREVEYLKSSERQQPFSLSGIVSCQSTPLTARDGRVVGMISTHWREVHTPQERELRLLDVLARQAADFFDRRRALEALRASEAALREADCRKDELLAMLAHELRNPLAPLRNVMETLHGQQLDGPQLERAYAMMDRQVAHLTRLVDDLLDVSRITRGLVELRREPVDVAEVADRAVQMAGPAIEGRGHELTIALPQRPLQVEGDVVRLTQVVFNLLNNAAKYTDPGGRIWLTVERDDPQAVVSVRDNGSGMKAELVPKVFDLFAQGERTLDRSQGGLGLGLTLVKRLVDMHGGTVEARSEGLGRGSTFTVWVPALPPEAKAPEPPLAAGVPVVAQVDRALVVDDSTDVAESMAWMLAGLAREIRMVHSGQAALDLAGQWRPDVILCDIGMPGMDGYETCRRLRRVPGLETAVIAAVTGYGGPEERRKSQAAGFDRHLVKPIGRATLEELVNSAAEA
jgi:signal transduction histidine kinase/DNA-binding response OmpR family regulator